MSVFVCFCVSVLPLHICFFLTLLLFVCFCVSVVLLLICFYLTLLFEIIFGVVLVFPGVWCMYLVASCMVFMGFEFLGCRYADVFTCITNMMLSVCAMKQ